MKRISLKLNLYKVSKKLLTFSVFVLCLFNLLAFDSHKDSIEICSRAIIAGEKVNSSLITDLDSENLRLLRNTIYARQGYIFRDHKLANYFKRFKWYREVPGKKIKLSDIDKYNLKIISWAQSENILKKYLKINTRNKLQKDESYFVGLWHASPVLASGWNETFGFYKSGKVVFRSNEMNCSNRVIWKSGKWKYEDGAFIILWEKRCLLQGGKLVKSLGSCASDYEIENGVFSVENINSSSGIKYTVLKKGISFEKQLILINKVKFWKYSNDPNDY